MVMQAEFISRPGDYMVPVQKEVLSTRIIDLLKYEFDGFDLSLYPTDTRDEVICGFLRRYWKFGWKDAWDWAAYSVAKIVKDISENDIVTLRHCLALIADWEAGQRC
jgi:hypothetical protein